MDRDRQYNLEKQINKKIRKHSFRHLNFSDLDEPKNDQYSLKKYICSNVQSKRNNLLALYTTTISDPENIDANKLTQNIFSPSNLQEHKKHRHMGNLEKIDKIKNINHLDSSQQDNMIVSSKFPLKAQERQSPLKKLRWRSVQTNRTLEPNSTVKPGLFKDEKKRKPPLPVLPDIKLKNSRRRVGDRRNFKNEINPWQYLVIPDQTVFINT